MLAELESSRPNIPGTYEERAMSQGFGGAAAYWMRFAIPLVFAAGILFGISFWPGGLVMALAGSALMGVSFRRVYWSFKSYPHLRGQAIVPKSEE
jgi:hypothetical protein